MFHTSAELDRQSLTDTDLQEAKSIAWRLWSYFLTNQTLFVEFDVSEMSNEVSGIDIYELLYDVVKYISGLASALSGRQ